MPVFSKTDATPQSIMSFTKLPFAPRQPPSDAKKFPIDYKKVNPMLMG